MITTKFKESSVDSYFVVPMPLNADGVGPCDPGDTVEIEWQVWDVDFQLVASYETEEEAHFRAGELNAIV